MPSSQVVDNPGSTASKVSIKQEPGVAKSAAAATVPKLTIKSESLERTVVAQTLSTTFVHVSELQMLLKEKIIRNFSDDVLSKNISMDGDEHNLKALRRD